MSSCNAVDHMWVVLDHPAGEHGGACVIVLLAMPEKILKEPFDMHTCCTHKEMLPGVTSHADHQLLLSRTHTDPCDNCTGSLAVYAAVHNPAAMPSTLIPSTVHRTGQLSVLQCTSSKQHPRAKPHCTSVVTRCSVCPRSQNQPPTGLSTPRPPQLTSPPPAGSGWSPV